jgi:hypothetical protein
MRVIVEKVTIPSTAKVLHTIQLNNILCSAKLVASISAINVTFLVCRITSSDRKQLRL